MAASQKLCAFAQLKFALTRIGAVAQLGERLHGMQEVRGSIPLGSTMNPIAFAKRTQLGEILGIFSGEEISPKKLLIALFIGPVRNTWDL